MPHCSVPLVFCVAALLLFSSTAYAQAPTTAPAVGGREDLDALITQLGSRDWSARAAAQSRLTRLGDLAEEKLKRAAAETGDDEVRARAESALAQIAENRLTGPTLVTLQLTDVAPRVAFEELARKASVELRPQSASMWNRNALPVTIDVTCEPFWHAVDRLREQCGMDLAWSGTCLSVVPAPRGRAAAPTVVHGPFRIRASRVTRSYAVDLTNGPGAAGAPANEFFVELTVQAEPKLRLSPGASPVAKLEVAEDEHGASLLSEDDAGGAAAVLAARRMAARVRAGTMEFTSTSGGLQWTARAPLALPAQGAGKRLARLKGTTAALLITRADSLELADVMAAQNVTKTVGGSNVTVKGCRSIDNQQYELALSLPRDMTTPVGRTVLRGALDTIRLFDAQGRELSRTRGHTTAARDAIHVTLTYAQSPGPLAAAGAASGPPAKLLWQVPLEIRETEIPFEFTDLPLP